MDFVLRIKAWKLYSQAVYGGEDNGGQRRQKLGQEMEESLATNLPLLRNAIAFNITHN